MRVALGVAGTLAYPEATVADARTVPLDSLLAPLFPKASLRYAVYCGTASVFEKYTVQCIDASGRAVAYVKLSRGPEAPEAILNEATVLAALAQRPDFEGAIPRVLHVAEVWECRLSVLGAPAVAGKRAPPFPPLSVARFAHSLFESETRVEMWAGSPVRQSMVAAGDSLQGLGEGDAAELIRRAVGALDADFGSTPIPHGRVHGDFVPWNVRLAPNPYVFDWEWSRISLPFHDLLHFLCFPAMLRDTGGLGARDGEAVPHRLALQKLMQRYAPAALPFRADDDRWPRAYFAQAYAFYARTTASGGASPTTHPLVRAIRARLTQSLGRR